MNKTDCPRCNAAMVCQPGRNCWCVEVPRTLLVPADANTACFCPDCLRESRMLADPVVIQAQLDQLDAAFKAAARPEPPSDAKPGDWLCGYVDYIEHPGGYREAVGPKLWTPRRLSLARFLLLRDLGRAQ